MICEAACSPSVQPFGLLVLHHSATNNHHERHRHIDLLVRTSFGRVDLPRLSAFPSRAAANFMEEAR